MIVAFTGHRPDKLGGYKLPNPTYNYLCSEIERILLELNPEKVISGMALGIDQWAAYIAYKLKIPFTAAVPFAGQEKAWPKHSQSAYHTLLNKASTITLVSEGGYTAQKMQIRNEWMVDRCNTLIGVWDGSSGGTCNCIKYAEGVGREIIHINPLKTVKH
jgi:uncharacterized phage-like protein YoqJ